MIGGAGSVYGNAERVNGFILEASDDRLLLEIDIWMSGVNLRL